MHTRECLNAKLPIYKLGRSHQLDKRVKQYPTGSQIMCQIYCSNSILCEKKLIELFTKLFIRKKTYGNEYFEGNVDDMIFTIFKYLYKDKFINNIINIEPLQNTLEVLPLSQGLETAVQDNTVGTDIKHKDRTCPTCLNIYRYPHMLKHHFENTYHCKKSEADINSFFVSNKLNKQQINSIQCNNCKKYYKTKKAYYRHCKETNCLLLLKK